MCKGGGVRVGDRRALGVDRVDVPGRAETRPPDELLNSTQIQRLADDSTVCPVRPPIGPLSNDDVHHSCSRVGQSPRSVRWAVVDPVRPRLLDARLMGEISPGAAEPTACRRECLASCAVDVERSRGVCLEERYKRRALRREAQVLAVHGTHPRDEILEVLIDRDRDGLRLFLLQPGQRALVVLIGRIEQVHARTDHRNGDQQGEHGDVLGRERRKPPGDPFTHGRFPTGV